MRLKTGYILWNNVCVTPDFHVSSSSGFFIKGLTYKRVESANECLASKMVRLLFLTIYFIAQT